MERKEKVCAVCGGIVGKYRHRTCGEECARVLRRQSAARCRERKKAQRILKRGLTHLEEFALEADSAKMTYGKYVARIYGEPHIRRMKK